MRGGRQAVTVAALLPGLSAALCAPALAGWSSSRTVATPVETATFAYPGGAQEPPVPAAEPAGDGTVTLTWPATELAGVEPRAMTGYVVTAVTPDGVSAGPAGCSLTIAPTVTCTGVDRALAETHGFTVRPVFRSWAGAASAASEPLAPEASAMAAAQPAEEPAGPDPVADTGPEPTPASAEQPAGSTGEPVQAPAGEEPAATQGGDPVQTTGEPGGDQGPTATDTVA